MYERIPKAKRGTVLIPWCAGDINAFFRRAKEVLPVKHYRVAMLKIVADGVVYQYERVRWTRDGWAGEG